MTGSLNILQPGLKQGLPSSSVGELYYCNGNPNEKLVVQNGSSVAVDTTAHEVYACLEAGSEWIRLGSQT